MHTAPYSICKRCQELLFKKKSDSHVVSPWLLLSIVPLSTQGLAADSKSQTDHFRPTNQWAGGRNITFLWTILLPTACPVFLKLLALPPPSPCNQPSPHPPHAIRPSPTLPMPSALPSPCYPPFPHPPHAISVTDLYYTSYMHMPTHSMTVAETGY